MGEARKAKNPQMSDSNKVQSSKNKLDTQFILRHQ